MKALSQGMAHAARCDSPSHVYDDVHTDSEVEEPPLKNARIEDDLSKTIDQFVQGQKDMKVQLDKICLELKQFKTKNKRRCLRHRKNLPALGEYVSSSSDDETSNKLTARSVPTVKTARRKLKRRLTNNNGEAVGVPKTNVEHGFISPTSFSLISRCCFCWKKDHSADDCKQFVSLKYRCYSQSRYNLCSRCLFFHPGKLCFLENRCSYCDKTDHHPSLCPSDKHRQFLWQSAKL